MFVTKMSTDQATRHVEDAFESWRDRSRFDWALDLSILVDAGVEVARPPVDSARSVHAETELAKAQEIDRLKNTQRSPDVAPTSGPQSVQARPTRHSAARRFRLFRRR
jgi:hypothetical protein